MSVQEYDFSHGFREGKLFLDTSDKSEFASGVVLSADGRITHVIVLNPEKGEAKEIEAEGIEPRRLPDHPDMTCYLVPAGSPFSCLPEKPLKLSHFLALWASSTNPESYTVSIEDRAFVNRMFGGDRADLSDDIDEVIKRKLRKIVKGESTFLKMQREMPGAVKEHIASNALRIFDNQAESVHANLQHQMMLSMSQELMAHLIAYEKKLRGPGGSVSQDPAR